jgi:hypothetical protein
MTTQNLYTLGTGTVSSSAFTPVISNNDPLPQNVSGPGGTFQIGQRWVNTSANTVFTLTSLAPSQGQILATWTQSANAGSLDTLTANTGTAIPVSGVIQIAGGGNISTSATGNVVTISSSLSYSTGTFTPTLTFGGASMGITYATQLGIYTQIGSVVFININISLSNKGFSSGIAQINGLPFTSSSDNQHSEMTSYIVNISPPSLFTGSLFEVSQSSTSGNLLYQASSGSISIYQDTNLTNSTAFRISGFYFI